MSIHEKFQRCSETTCNDGSSGTRLRLHPQERTRQRPIDLQQRSHLRDECQQWKHIRGTQAPSSSSSSTKWWNSQLLGRSSTVARMATRRMARSAMVREMVNTIAPPLLQKVLHIRSVLKISLTDNGECRARDVWSEDRTPHLTQHTRILFSLRAV